MLGSQTTDLRPIRTSISQRAIRIARRVHLWIALCLGFHFSLIATTGAIFVFHEELHDLAFAWRGWTASDGDIGPERCADAIAAAYPEWDRASLAYPSHKRPFYSTFVGEEDAIFWTDVYVDPGTGRIVGSINNLAWSVEGLLQVSIQLHIRLCAGEWGRRCVDVSVSLFLLELCTGLFLWWPGLRRLSHGFKIRSVRKRFLAIYDWHRVSGVIAAPLLLIMTLTGLLWGFPTIMVPLVYWSCGEVPPTTNQRDTSTSEPAVSIEGTDPHDYCSRDEIDRIVKDSLPMARISGMYLHGPNQRHATVSGEITGNGRVSPEAVSIEVDRLTRQATRQDSVQRQSVADQLVNDWAHPLHYGDFGGITTKLLYLAACLAVDGLFVTGFWIWIIKSRKIAGNNR